MATMGVKKATADIFSLTQHARFLAAAASATSIPKLYGAPEASEGKCISCTPFTNDPYRSFLLDVRTSANRLS